MNSFKLDKEVQDKLKEFQKHYTDYINDNLRYIGTVLGKIDFLVREVSCNDSAWSGGHSLTNFEESVKRDIAFNALREVSNHAYAVEQFNSRKKV